LCSLRKRDIGEDTITVTGKTGQREIPISEETRRRLDELAANIRPDDHIFRGRKGNLKRTKVYDIVHKYMILAGINGPKLGPHRIRHAFGKGYLMAGGDLRSLQMIMGHASIKTTEIYTTLTTGDIVNKHHQFNLLRSARAAAQGSFLDKSGVLKEAEAILQNNERR
jgi:integrase/recombinase XerD